MREELSLDEKVLLSAYELERSNQTPFSAEDLVIAAWKKFPDAFGLEGYGNQYPDSNRVFTKIMGDKGLRGRGWLLKVGEKRYRLSEAGKAHARTRSVEDSSSPSRSSLSREQKEALRRLLQSRAVQKVKDGLHDTVIFLDACSFWDISARSSANTLSARLASVESMIEIVGKLIEENQSLAFVHGDIAITKEDQQRLKNTHEFLLDKFQSELAVIRKRKDDRKIQ
jgi:hypothetical protein